MGKNLHFFQHVSFEGLGSIKEWIIERQHTLTATRFYEDVWFPEVEAIDGLIIMGGSMSVWEEESHPSLKLEKSYLKKFLATGKPVLWICFGAQLIASVLGSKVYPNTQHEIGWFPIRFIESVSEYAHLDFGPERTVFHWHGDTFDLPSGSHAIGSSKATPNQGFLLGSQIAAFQFHLEVRPKDIETLVDHAYPSEQGHPYVQSKEELLLMRPEISENNRLLASFLDQFFK